MTAVLDYEYVRATEEVEKAGIASADPLTMSLPQAREIQRRYFEFLARDAPDIRSVQDFTLRTDFGCSNVRVYFPSTGKPLPVKCTANGVMKGGEGAHSGRISDHLASQETTS